jgi:hypothetical protein
MGSKWEDKDRPSKTIQRPSNATRVVITVEVELSKEMMKAAAAQHLYDATDVMREALKNVSSPGGVDTMLDEWRSEGDLFITESKVEVNK